jgi:F-type H+-transporting ATPase subunit epsilon
MPESLTLKIVTPDQLYFEGPVEHVMASGYKGYLGILKNHAPLVTPLTPGRLTYRQTDGKTSTVQVEGGFLEILKNRVLVLTDRVQFLGS